MQGEGVGNVVLVRIRVMINGVVHGVESELVFKAGCTWIDLEVLC
jgi:hypothetical protein